MSYLKNFVINPQEGSNLKILDPEIYHENDKFLLGSNILSKFLIHKTKSEKNSKLQKVENQSLTYHILNKSFSCMCESHQIDLGVKVRALDKLFFMFSLFLFTFSYFTSEEIFSTEKIPRSSAKNAFFMAQ